ncbi:MAG: putative metal-dependent hydrolase [Chitinophagaceae bacterium]|nr:putative metal-dependent hydrolase [Chitinophagaceae bacterium]
MIEADKTQQLRFPIGMFEFGKSYSNEEIQQMTRKIDEFPGKLKRIITGLTKEQLDATYRQDGWTIRQVIHHLADSHMNAYIRFKLALTEDMPTIKPYDPQAWSELEDGKNAATSFSFDLLFNLHKRWAILLKSMSEQDFERVFYHPEHQMSYELKEILAMYIWHGEHHYNHILKAKEKFSASKSKAKKVTATKSIAKKADVKKAVKPEVKKEVKK